MKKRKKSQKRATPSRKSRKKAIPAAPAGDALAGDVLARAAEARSLLETAVAFKPGFADALNNLGNVLKAEGALDEAEEDQLLSIQYDGLIGFARRKVRLFL